VDEELPPALPAPPARTGYGWITAGALAVAGAGALYLMTRKGKRRRLTGRAKKAWGRVKGGLLVAALSGFMNRASQKAAERVIG